MASKRKKAVGGYRFARFTGQPQPELVEAGIPPAVTIGRTPAGMTHTRLLVEEGETVTAGQIIARDDETVGSPLLATVNGTVEKISKGGNAGPTVVIRSDGTDSWRPMAEYSAEWNNLSSEVLEKLIYLSGGAGTVAGGIPTRFNSAAIQPKEVEHILLQVMPAEVFNPLISTLLGEREIGQLAEGLAILAKIMPRAAVHLVGGKQQRSLLSQTREACRQFGLDRVHHHTLATKYPYHREEILVPAVLGQEFPYGFSAINLGVVILDLQVLLQLRDTVMAGKPAIDRVVALAGKGFPKRPHLRLRIGTPLEQVLEQYLDGGREFRIVRNSILTGDALKDTAQTVDSQMSAMIAVPEEKQGPPLPFSRPGFRTDSYSRTFIANFVPFTKTVDTNIHGEHRPCIACTYCDDVCPVGILPHLLHRYVQRGVIDETILRYRIFDCIDCNLCTYVCTSKIPLAQLMRKGKDSLAAEGLDPRGEAVHRLQLKGVPVTEEEQA
jgi:Na(+)-translocating NADH:ubiquinone oxidoreductase A subunit